MIECTNKYEKVENELYEIASELTALGDMIPGLFQNFEDTEPETPIGIKILLKNIRNRTDKLREYFGNNFRKSGTDKGY